MNGQCDRLSFALVLTFPIGSSFFLLFLADDSSHKMMSRYNGTESVFPYLGEGIKKQVSHEDAAHTIA
jgi:hypothetical protein